MALQKSLLDILACPKCKSNLAYKEADGFLVCHSCSLQYAVKDDIPDMLIEHATPAANK